MLVGIAIKVSASLFFQSSASRNIILPKNTAAYQSCAAFSLYYFFVFFRHRIAIYVSESSMQSLPVQSLAIFGASPVRFSAGVNRLGPVCKTLSSTQPLPHTKFRKPAEKQYIMHPVLEAKNSAAVPGSFSSGFRRRSFTHLNRHSAAA